MNPDWDIPTDEDVHVTYAGLVDANLRRLFFGGLQNPNWVEPLAKLGAFSTDPPSWVDETGVRRALPWPEGEYLARVASAEPALVAAILLEHSRSENEWVRQVVVEAALNMPAEHAVKLAPQIARAVRTGYGWVDALKVVALAELIATNNPKQSRSLLASAFEPQPGGDEASVFGTRTRVALAVDAYWLQELTPRLSVLLTSFGLDGLKSAVGWLLRAVDIPTGGAVDDGSSHVWRPSIEPHEQNSGVNEIADALIDLTRDVASNLATDHFNEVITFLEGLDRPLTTRIAMAVTTRVIEATQSRDAIDIARVMLGTERLLDIDARPEYVALARSALGRISHDDVSAWRTMIDAGRWQGDEETLRRIAGYGLADGSAVTDDDVRQVRERMRYRLLLPLIDVLPTDLRSEVTELRETMGELEHPEFGSFSTSFVGPVSPVDQVALAQMTAQTLLQFLRDWQPSTDRHFGPSREGLARELEKVAESDPRLVEPILPDLFGVGRSYLRAVVNGLSKALATAYEPGNEVWQVLLELAQLPDSGDPVNADFEADDPVWRWAQRAAADFTAAYIDKHNEQLDSTVARRAWEVLKPLCDHADPTLEHEERYGGSNMDPLTLSLNTTRPAAIRASIKLLRVTAGGDDAFDSIRSEIFEMLDAKLNDPSLAVAAVLGEAIGHLVHINRDWVEAHHDLLDITATDDATRQRADVIVSVALRIYRTGPVFIELMRPVFLNMLGAEYERLSHVDGWRGDRPPREAAASHIVTAVVTGLIDHDDELYHALETPTTPPLMAEALGTLGWTLMRAYDGVEDTAPVRDDVLARARTLVDARVAAIRAGEASVEELSDLYWWPRIPSFPAEWWLPILGLAAESPSFNPKGMLGGPLALASTEHPLQAVEILRRLLPQGDEPWQRYDLLQHAPQILANALSSQDANAQQVAREVLDQLGRQGHLGVLAEVDQLLAVE